MAFGFCCRAGRGEVPPDVLLLDAVEREGRAERVHERAEHGFVRVERRLGAPAPAPVRYEQLERFASPSCPRAGRGPSTGRIRRAPIPAPA